MVAVLKLTLLLAILNCVNTTTACDNSIIETCISRLIETTLPSDATLVQVFDEDSSYYFNQINVNNPRIIINIKNHIMLSSLYYTNYLLYMQSPISLDDTLMKLQNGIIWNPSKSPQGNFLVITNDINNIAGFFSILWNHDVINSIVIVYDGINCTVPRVFLYEPFLPVNKCGGEINFLFRYECTILLNISFHGYIKNLNRCGYGGKANSVHAGDPRASPAAAILYGATDELFQTLNASSYTFGRRNLLNNRSANVLASTVLVRSPELWDDYDLTDQVYEDVFVWIVPKPAKIIGIRAITFTYDIFVWMMIIVATTVSIIAWWLVAKYSTYDNNVWTFGRSFLAILVFTLGSSEHLAPKSAALKFVVVFYALYCILLCTSFQANLVSILTEPKYERAITSVEEMADSNLNISKISFFESTHMNTTYNPTLYAKLKQKFVVKPTMNHTRELIELLKYRNSCVLIGDNARKMVIPDATQVDSFASELLPLEMSLSFRKGHYLLPTFNRLLKIMHENGFIKKIIERATFKDIIYEEPPHIALGMEHLYEIFVFWGICLFLTCIVFILELLAVYRKQRKINIKERIYHSRNLP